MADSLYSREGIVAMRDAAWAGMAAGYAGVRIIESVEAYEPVEDWSHVRSPSRATRRRRQGHRQNIVIRRKPIALEHIDGTLIVHPAIADQMRREIAVKRDAVMRATLFGGIGQGFVT